MQRIARWLYLFTLAALALPLAGCNSEQFVDAVRHAGQDGFRQDHEQQVGTTVDPGSPSGEDTITIASFNIQVFGQSKLGKPHAMEILAKVARRFDVMAIQEIRSKEQNVIPEFVELINADGSQYDYLVGPRLGRTMSKEQYAVVYDASRIEPTEHSSYTVPDPEDLLHREPMVTHFRVRGPPRSEAFSFELVNIHTDPDETDQELDALADVFVYVQQNNPQEDDVILLGDLNVDEHDLGRLGQLPNIHWTVENTLTNTRKTECYDNIIFDREATVEYGGQWGVLDLMEEFDLTMDEALEVSDHLPVWAVFSCYEDQPALRVATQPERRDRAGQSF